MNKPATPYGDAHPTELSTPVPREEVHNRRISCNGFVREDGLYDIEAELTDNKTYQFPTEFRGDVTPDQFIHHVFDSLVGLTIGPGWRRRVTDAIGGRHGCTHITELMGVVGTIAYQTRYGEDARRRRLRVGATGMETAKSRSEKRTSVLANSCIAYATDED